MITGLNMDDLEAIWDMISLEMTMDHEQYFRDTMLNVIDYLVKCPDRREEMTKHYPFNKDEFKDVDWDKVTGAHYEGKTLILELK